MKENRTAVSPLAREALTDETIQYVVRLALALAEAKGWRPGQCFSETFTLKGEGYCVALNFTPEGKVEASVAKPQEILWDCR